MASSYLPVDLLNPGQVFACLGLVEAAEQLFGEASGGFDWRNGAAEFLLQAPTDENPLQLILKTFASAKVASVTPQNSDLSTDKWKIPTEQLGDDEPYPINIPSSPATLPAQLRCSLAVRPHVINIDHWGDSTQRDNAKFWAGAAGYPGAALLRDSLDLVRTELAEGADDPFNIAKPQSSSFRFDWRRDYIPLDLGFSPNEHSNVTMVGYPIVEILAAVGLSHARPQRVGHSKLLYRYAVLGIDSAEQLHDPIFLRAALGGAELPFPMRHFSMHLGWPGQENQARCITHVTEETKG